MEREGEGEKTQEERYLIGVSFIMIRGDEEHIIKDEWKLHT